MNEKILEKLEDMEFAKKLISIESEEDVIKAFKEENVDISKEEVKELGNIVSDMISKMSEMPENQLKKISGGNFQDGLNHAAKIYATPGRMLGLVTSNSVPFKADNTVMADVAIGNATCLAVTALQTYGIYQGGKWAINKGKQWWNNRKK